MRVATACKQCRDGKRKCINNPTSAEPTCLPCRTRNLSCSKANNFITSSSRELAPSTLLPSGDAESTASDAPLTHTEVCHFVDLYLRFVHDRPHSLFHVQSLWDELKSGNIDQCLILAICAIGCRFSTDARYRDFYTTLGARASSLFSQQLEELSLCNVQTSILLANFYAAKRDNELEALYFGESACGQ